MEEHIRVHREVPKESIHLKNELKSLSQLGDFDVIGFDADHTLIRYNVKDLAVMIDKCFVSTLCEECKGYPEEIENFPEDAVDIALNGVVFDMNNERLIKISDDSKVMRAFHGFTELEDDEITEIYGPERHFEFTPWEFRNREKGFAGFHTYFDSPGIVVIAKMMELKKKGLLEKTGKEMLEDVYT
mmetsp:Transcript_34513/g.39937  ORF Transcript_34513/g.39937 Transcript_34513/m.39937 type:complete len:186 (+) Transcript_34513:33-590(+)